MQVFYLSTQIMSEMVSFFLTSQSKVKLRKQGDNLARILVSTVENTENFLGSTENQKSE